MPSTVELHLDGKVVIDGESLVLPDGLDLRTAVTQHLRMQAADDAATVLATIHEQATGTTVHLAVHPDGTTQEHRPDPGLPPLPPEHRPALDEVHALALLADLPGAIAGADLLLAEVSASLGPEHPGTLVVAQTRADLAWLDGDVVFATDAWMWIAAAWTRHLPLGTRAIGSAARNAVAAWTRLDEADALPRTEDLLDLLTRVAPDPVNNATVAGVRRRLSTMAPALHPAE